MPPEPARPGAPGARRRVPLAEAIALLAIVLSLTAGGAVASHLVVKTSDLAANAVDGSKVDNGTMTGADVKEPSLGKVPSTLNVSGSSAKRFRKAAVATTGEEPLASLGGLRLSYECTGGLAFVPTIHARSIFDDATIMSGVVSSGDSYAERYSDLDRGEAVQLDESRASLGVRFTYTAPNGSIVSGSLDLAATPTACMIQGVLLGA